MTVKEIIEKYLRENGFDGLVYPELECGCGLDDGEIGVCDSINLSECMPAYKHFYNADSTPCNKCEDAICQNTEGDHCFSVIKEGGKC